MDLIDRLKIHARIRKKTRRTRRCWFWQGAKNDKGYGQISVSNRTEYVHRLSFWLNFGPISKGQYVLHKCDRPSCLKPSHLFAGTARDNSKDCVSKRRHNFQFAPPKKKKKHCPQGHPYSGKNLYIIPKTGWRVCKTCYNESRRRRRAKERNESNKHL